MSYINPYLDTTSRFRLLDTSDWKFADDRTKKDDGLLTIGSLTKENAALLDKLVFGSDDYTFNHTKYSLVNLDDSFASVPSYNPGWATGTSLRLLSLNVGSDPKGAKYTGSIGMDYNYFRDEKDVQARGGIGTFYISNLLRSPKLTAGETDLYATLGLGFNYSYTHGSELLDGQNALRWDINSLTLNCDKLPFLFGGNINLSYQLYMSGTLSQSEKMINLGGTDTIATGTDAYRTMMGAGSLNSASGSDTFKGSFNAWQRFNLGFEFKDTANYMPSIVTLYYKTNTSGDKSNWAVGGELFNKQGMYGNLEGVREGELTKWSGNLNMQFVMKDLITWKGDKGEKKSIDLALVPNIGLPYFNNPNGLSFQGGLGFTLTGLPIFETAQGKLWVKSTAPEPKKEETTPQHVEHPTTIGAWSVDPSLGPGQLSQIVSVDAPPSAIVPGQNVTIEIYTDNAGDMPGITGWYPAVDGGSQITDDYVPMFLEGVTVVDYGNQSNPIAVPVTFMKEEILDNGTKKITIQVNTSAKAYQAMKVQVKVKTNAAKLNTFKATAGSTASNLVIKWNL
jgi:hypothetical protein